MHSNGTEKQMGCSVLTDKYLASIAASLACSICPGEIFSDGTLSTPRLRLVCWIAGSIVELARTAPGSDAEARGADNHGQWPFRNCPLLVLQEFLANVLCLFSTFSSDKSRKSEATSSLSSGCAFGRRTCRT